MRSFSDTPEPTGEAGTQVTPDTSSRTAAATSGAELTDASPEQPRFVVQEHHATSLHWDLRLEHDGVLWSFAVPKGLPWSPEENHLAVRTEDHPLEYLDFSGEIPEGNYGAGRMSVWDEGTYEPEEMADDKVRVVLHGRRVQGRYALFPTRGRNWMIHRMDPPSDAARRPLPTDLRPMRPNRGALPLGDEWRYELCWVGERVLIRSAGGRATVTDARGTEVMADAAKQVRGLGAALGTTEAVLDGVLVGLDAGGGPVADADVVERALATAGARRADSPALAVMLFDLLWLDGRPLVDAPLQQRRARLEELDLHGVAWQTPQVSRLHPGALLDAAVARGFPGLVAKSQQGLYLPGRTADDWMAGDRVEG